MEFKWDKNAAKKITVEAMHDLSKRGQSRLRTVTCPVHLSVHEVVWNAQGLNVNVTVKDPCCDALEARVQEATARAIR